jgi:glycerophosphoryl diester phosphodiesterase
MNAVTRQGPLLPLAIAHRSGNDLACLRRAEAAGVDLVEADIWLYRGRLEVRHLKTVGPVPILWDRWKLGNPWAPRLHLDELLSALQPDTEPMLDLKSSDPRTAHAVLETIEQFMPGRNVTICSQRWHLLDVFPADSRIRLVHSAGSAAQLRTLLRRLDGRESVAFSVHRRLLTPASVAAMRRLTALIMTWPINTPECLTEVLALGANGIISDELPLLHRMIEQRLVSR